MASLRDYEDNRKLGADASDEVIEWRACNRFSEYGLKSVVTFDDGHNRIVDYVTPKYMFDPKREWLNSGKGAN